MANIRMQTDKKQLKVVNVRVNEGEYLRIKEIANSNGVTISKMLRAAIHGRTINSRTDEMAICELRRQGELIKQAIADNRISDDIKTDLQRLIPLIIDAIKKISEK